MIVDVYWDSRKKSFSVRCVYGKDHGKIIARRHIVWLKDPHPRPGKEIVRGEYMPRAWCSDTSSPDTYLDAWKEQDGRWYEEHSRWWYKPSLSDDYTSVGDLARKYRWRLALCISDYGMPAVWGRMESR